MKYDYITYATDERLAEMLDGIDECDEHCIPIYSIGEIAEIQREAARRLRSRGKVPFNHEAFE